jgi:hypothetical protein
MAHRDGHADLRQTQVSSSCQHFGFAWLAEYSFNTRYKKGTHQEKNNQLLDIKKK